MPTPEQYAAAAEEVSGLIAEEEQYFPQHVNCRCFDQSRRDEMATPAQYAAAAKAVSGLIAEEEQYIPYFVRAQIPADMVQKFAHDAARRALDAAEKTK